MKKRFLSLLAALCLALSLLPTAAWAEDAAATGGTIEEITESGIVDEAGENITVSGSSLQWYAADAGVGRNSDGWWIGVKITAPSTVTASNVSSVKYSNTSTGDLTKSFASNRDGDFFINCWVLVNQDYLAAALAGGSDIVYTYRFDWDGDNTVDQTFTVTVDPANITLSKDGAVQCKTENGVMTTSATDSVAAIGDVSFTTLAAAVAAAKSGDTVKLIGNVTLTDKLSISETLTLDLNGHTLTASSGNPAIVVEENGDLTVTDGGTGGRIIGYHNAINVDQGTLKLTGGTLSIGSGVATAYAYGVYAEGGGTVYVKEGATIDVPASALSGNNTTAPSNFYISGGLLKSSSSPAIYKPDVGTVEISGGELYGGLLLRMGDVTISGGKIINNVTNNTDALSVEYKSANIWFSNAVTVYSGCAAYTSEVDGDDGNLKLTITGGEFSTSVAATESGVSEKEKGGDGLAVYVAGGRSQDIDITISGGTFSSNSSVEGSKAVAVYDVEDLGVTDENYVNVKNEAPTNAADLSITGGTFSAKPDESYIADGYCWNETAKTVVKSITVTAKDQAITYGQSIATGTSQVEVAGLADGDTLASVDLTASAVDVATENKTVTPSNAVIKRGDTDVTANYEIAYVPGTLTVNKAAPSYEVPTGLTATVGQTLADVTLPDGWAWDDESTSVGEAGEHAFSATFTPTDTANYTTVTANVTITVSAAHVHSYGDPVWTWAEDKSSATAAFTCTADDDKQEVNAAVTSKVTTQADCATAETTTYTATATFGGTEYTDVKKAETAAALGHTYGDAWVYDAAGHWHVCTRCGEASEKTAHVYADAADVTCDICGYERSLTYAVSGTITAPDGVYSGVTAKLVDLEGTETAVELTKTDGGWTYSVNVPAGYYNLVVTGARENGNTNTVTALIDLSADTEQNAALPEDDVNSVVSVGEGAPAVLVGGLDDEAAARGEAGSTVTVTMSVAAADETAEGAEDIQALADTATNAQVEFLTIAVEKTVDDGKPAAVKETNTVLTVIIPFDFTGKANVTLYRYHDGKPEALTQADAKLDGAYRLDKEGGFIVLSARKFSTYAIGYQSVRDALTDAIAAAQAAAANVEVSETNGSDISRSDLWVTREAMDAYEKAIAAAQTAADNETDNDALAAALTALAQATEAFETAQDYGNKSTPTTHYTTTRTAAVAAVTVTLPDGTVKTVTPVNGQITVSVPGATPGTVAVIAAKDGAETLLRNAVVVDGSIVLDVTGGESVKLIDNAKDFVDVADSDWFKSSADFVSARELFAGVDDTHFAPTAAMTRGMLATVLFRLDGETASAASGKDFSDVADGDWFAQAVDWASAQGIITGYPDGTFGPGLSITRQELAAMLYRYAGSPEVDAADMAGHADADAVSDWAEAAMRWAVGSGVIQGKDGARLDPQGDATRAEVAAMLTRYLTGAAN